MGYLYFERLYYSPSSFISRIQLPAPTAAVLEMPIIAQKYLIKERVRKADWDFWISLEFILFLKNLNGNMNSEVCFLDAMPFTQVFS